MRSKDQEADRIAQAHYRVEEGMIRIFRLRGTTEQEANENEPIKLLEINRFTVPSGIVPIYFGPAPRTDWCFPMAIVEVTPEEFEQIQSKEIELPNDWSIAEPIEAAAEAASAL